MAEILKQGKEKTSFQIKEEFRKGRGSKLLDSILDILLSDDFDSETADWCLWLLSGGQEPDKFLKDLKSRNTSPVCGLVWNAHFVAYRCRDCAISPCMSLCVDCFVNGDHEGHDFNMFRSQAGGACDCGDENVMRKQGFCINHCSSKVVKKETLPNELSAIAQTIIARLFLKIYEESEAKPNDNPPTRVKSIKGIISVLQKLCEADEMRLYIAKTILTTVPQQAKAKHRRTNSFSSASQLRSTISTESGHTFVHSVPDPPRSPDYLLESQGLEISEYHVSSPVEGLGIDGSPFSYLEYLMHLMVELEFPNYLATFMLLLLPDQTYKESFTRSFCRNYLSIGKKLSQSMVPEMLSNHVVHVSVQLFSSEVLATAMVHEEKLLDILIAVLVDMVGSCLQSYKFVTEDKDSSVLVANCDHRILINHCYWPVTSDLLNILSHKQVIKTFVENDQLLHQWLYLVTLVTGMNVNTHRISSHIQFEPRTYVTSFSVEFESVAAVMWELLRGCNKLKSENDRYIQKMIKTTEAALHEWYNFVPAKPWKSTATFHLSLHRYYALFISQAVVSFGLKVSEVFPQNEFLAKAMEYPLRTLVTLSEIKAGYWVYNGFQMRGQALSYVQCNFCNSMVDLDVLFVQLAASRLDPDFFLTLLIERFSLNSWFQFGVPIATFPARQDTEKETSMVESFLSFLLILISQRVFVGSSEHQQCKKDLAALLCVSNKTHSQLSDMIPTKPGENQEKSKKFEIALQEMADFKAPTLESDVMQQGTYSPKNIVWDNYFDYTHILLRFFMASEYQKANKRYSENMKDRGTTIHTNCWPPFKDPDDIHPSFKGIFRLLHCSTMQKIIFFILYKAVYSENAVSELMLINTIHLFYHAMRAPKIEEEGAIVATEKVEDKRIKAAEKCLDYLEEFASDTVGLYEDENCECVEEVNYEDIISNLKDKSTKIVTANLLKVLFAKNDLTLFEPMLAYMDNAVDDNTTNPSIFLRHLHHLRYLLSIVPEDRYHFLKKLFLHWRRCAARDNMAIDMYPFFKERHDLLEPGGWVEEQMPKNKCQMARFTEQRSKDHMTSMIAYYADQITVFHKPGFPMLLKYFTKHFDWLFRINKIDPGELANVFDIEYSKGSIVDNASVGIAVGANMASTKDDDDDNISEDQNEKVQTDEKQSLISLLVALLEKLKQTSKCIAPEKLSEAAKQQQNIIAGDGSFQISQLLERLHESNSLNKAVIDRLAPKIGKNGSSLKKRSGILDDSMKEKVERRKRAMARQKKILEEFMSKQEMFKEQNITPNTSMEIDQSPEVEASTTTRQFDCVICGQISSSTIDRPFGEAVLLQPTAALASRRKADAYDELPQQHQDSIHSCGNTVEQRKMTIIKNFDKVPAGRALEVGLDCGIHIQTCGHYLHIDCYQSYFKSLQVEHIRTYAYEHPQFDITKGFFSCPLCRQPCNAVLPILPDLIRKRRNKKITNRNNENRMEIMHLLRKYTEAGSLSALTAKALEFTVLTASTATFITLLTNTLKSEENLATTLYSDRTIKEKFLILVSTIRTCLEIDYIEVNCGLKAQDDRRSCMGNLIEILQFHAQCLDGPMINIWRELTNDRNIAESRTNDDNDHSQVPLLLQDPTSLLIQLVLTWPTWISIDHFRHLVKVLFNLHVIQAFVDISLKLQNEEFRSWQRMGQNLQASTSHAAYELLGVVSAALAQIRTNSKDDHDDTMTGISQSLLSPHAIELQIQEFCLPYLRLAASLSHVLFDTPINRHQDRKEFINLALNFCLVGDESGDESRDILPTQCCNWPFPEPNVVITSWCGQLVKVLGWNENKDLAMLPVSHNWSFPRLLPLPISYDRLFQFYRKQSCKTCHKVPNNPAVCLICGTFTCFRSSCCSNENGIYECVKHSIQCGCGTGIFLIISTSTVLIIRSERASIWGSVYLDSFGEEDKDLKRGKPLFLSNERYERLQKQWLAHSFDRTCKRWEFHNGKI